MKLSSKRIERKTKYLKVNSFNKLKSTNDTAREMAVNGAAEGTAVVASEQSAGRGRLGRTFLSKRGGVYFSIVLRPKEGVSPLLITVAAAVACARAIESVSDKEAKIKWVNDIYSDNKKVCGILTEGSFNADARLDYAVLGVGVNLFAPRGGFPPELPLAGSIFSCKSKIFTKNHQKERFFAEFSNFFFFYYKNLEKKEFMSEYQSRSMLDGKEITYVKEGRDCRGRVIGIDDEARLIVQTDGKTQALSHGEIQIIGMEQLLV